ncbi:hypothetical protein Tco_1350494 [Tanacetum coccineum]
MSLSSALIATIALLIIVIVVGVVVVVVAVVVVVVVIIVVGICRPTSTVSGQMVNSLAVIAPRHGLCSASYFVVVVVVVVDSDYFGSYDVSMDHVGQSPDIPFNFVRLIWEHPHTEKC